ncbi:ribosome small subunit-dependent GTPase A [Oceanirhabdus sp. W0125-5]|uniref:ribosome small subunit-dependent GTPase A n=1 Tax=Oceanirhabdus sp. W0125-5 TaxID=2999116 RepID=UPI0022F2B293|nr:ribosome small subunit-dependent GTPase A [Oceanirhabdus sp. W0125-5]WBW99190.1 ribosome small subunit-dependent GTPase A [Oceanirhabdus sp. W0125-5]
MIDKINLFKLGLKKDTLELFNEEYKEYFLGRVTLEHKHTYRVITENGEVLGRVSGKFNYEAFGTEDYPAVGDWVVLDRDSDKNGEAIIHKVLPRMSSLSRKVAGTRSDEQIIATNVDTVFICMALNNDFNIRRLERYISVVWESGANPRIILTKSDLCEDIELRVAQVEEVAIGIDIHVVCALEEEGIDEIADVIGVNDTVTFIGSSGIGKSTLINALLGEEKMLVNEIRESDHKGKHTTTHRELIKLSDGGVVIDTPGMRELQIYSVDFDASFKDVEELAEQCRFVDCKHKTEPGCAVKNAVNDGTLSSERFKSYEKLKRELWIMEKRKKFNERRAERKKNIKKFSRKS